MKAHITLITLGFDAGCFQDPDGHLWEVAFNPGFDDLA
jgi:predicted lactoylglutathione lyase